MFIICKTLLETLKFLWCIYELARNIWLSSLNNDAFKFIRWRFSVGEIGDKSEGEVIDVSDISNTLAEKFSSLRGKSCTFSECIPKWTHVIHFCFTISNRIIFTVIKHKYRFFITTTTNVELVFHSCTVVFVNYYLIYRFPRFNHTFYGPYSLESVLFFLVCSLAIFSHNFSVYVRIYLLVINLQRNSYETIWNFSWTDFAYMIRGWGGYRGCLSYSPPVTLTPR